MAKKRKSRETQRKNKMFRKIDTLTLMVSNGAHYHFHDFHLIILDIFRRCVVCRCVSFALSHNHRHHQSIVLCIFSIPPYYYIGRKTNSAAYAPSTAEKVLFY